MRRNMANGHSSHSGFTLALSARWEVGGIGLLTQLGPKRSMRSAAAGRLSLFSTVMTAARLAPSFLATDFDGTCTEKETIPLLPQLAACLGPAERASTKLATFQQLENAYMAGLNHILAQHELDGAPNDALNLEGLSSILREMDAHSTEITMQVGQSGCLADIPPQAVAGQLACWAASPETAPTGPATLRSGCANTLRSLAESGCGLGVLSINWSPALIRATLDPEVRHPFELWCNELLEDGTIVLPVPGAAEKRTRIASLVEQAAGRGPVVYVGDSATDLLGLIEADVGILIGESRSARRVARKFGVRLEPLPCSLGECNGRAAAAAADARGVVWEATCWEDIRRCLLDTPVVAY